MINLETLINFVKAFLRRPVLEILALVLAVSLILSLVDALTEDFLSAHRLEDQFSGVPFNPASFEAGRAKANDHWKR